VAEHPAARMRAAAARLRELAAAATEETGDGHGGWYPWHTVKDTKWVRFPEPREVPAAPYPFGDGGTELADGQHEPTGMAFVAHSVWAHDTEEDWHEPEFFAGPMPEQLAEYIAMMHPLMAAAVAGLLEDTARDAERLLTPRISACPHWEEERSCDCATIRSHYCGRCAMAHDEQTGPARGKQERTQR
jgi:hypothetical protein